jgi:hypothetical protein
MFLEREKAEPMSAKWTDNMIDEKREVWLFAFSE